MRVAAQKYTLLVPLKEGREEIEISGDSLKQSEEYLISDVFGLVFTVAAFFALVYLTLIGLQMVLSNINGNVFKYGELKGRFYDIILGIILLLFSYIIINTINPDLITLDMDIGRF